MLDTKIHYLKIDTNSKELIDSFISLYPEWMQKYFMVDEVIRKDDYLQERWVLTLAVVYRFEILLKLLECQFKRNLKKVVKAYGGIIVSEPE